MADEESVRKVRGMENGEANGGNNTVRDPMDNNCESKFNNTRSFDAKPEGMMDRGRQLSECCIFHIFGVGLLELIEFSQRRYGSEQSSTTD
ncbi:hypothetical protein TNIN_304371 [Trichonephila inaurata madagascariensis]|uniref:Uncharacterized protein n=1 Tax=Trichonephila inaurata madagascariensis TaxID=2747483 RepID=A0A8X6MD06_9ARAC|nr:hypothetical protein TNIN_304371 [Trichonephila inaurata madagascariensis]